MTKDWSYLVPFVVKPGTLIHCLFATSFVLIGPLVKPVGQWGGAQEYNLTCQMVIG